MHGQGWRLASVCAALAAGGTILGAPARSQAAISKDELTVRIYDIGQGSCVLVECPDGPPILNDCGRIGSGGDPDKAAGKIRGRLTDLRAAYPAPLQVLISHPHSDHYSILTAKKYGIQPADIRSLHYGGSFTTFSVKARGWIDDLAKGLDAAPSSTNCAPSAKVGCLGPNEHALATPRLQCGKATVDLLVANAYSYNRSLGAAGKTAQGTDANGESAILRIRYAGASIVLPGDAEEVSQLYASENATGLGLPIARASVLLLQHHGSSEYGSNDDAWVAATRPEVVVVSANIGGNYGHPNCEALGRFDAVTASGQAMAQLVTPMPVRCGRGKAKSHETITLHHQFVFTETEGDVVVRVKANGELSVGCETASAACKATP